MKEAWELFLHGGFVMWPLLVALIITVAIAIERIAYYRQLKREMFALNDALEDQFYRVWVKPCSWWIHKNRIALISF